MFRNAGQPATMILTCRRMAARIAKMRSRANTAKKKSETRAIRIQLSQRLYQRVEQTAHQTGYGVRELIVSTLETGLPEDVRDYAVKLAFADREPQPLTSPQGPSAAARKNPGR